MTYIYYDDCCIWDMHVLKIYCTKICYIAQRSLFRELDIPGQI